MGNSITINDPGGIGLQPIDIPLFLSLEQIDNFSVFSFIGLGLQVLFIGIMLVWVSIVIRSAIKYIQSQGDEGMIAESMKRIRNVLVGIAFTFGVVVVTSLVAAFFGIGNFFDWPKSFSFCDDELTSNSQSYFFQYVLAETSKRPQVTIDQLEQECFGGN